MNSPIPKVYVLGLTPCIQRTLQFDSLNTGEVNRCQKVIETASGKGTNVARALDVLGHQVELHTTWAGRNGEQFKWLVDKERWETYYYEIPGNTRICQTLIDKQNARVTEIVEESPEIPSEVIANMNAYLESNMVENDILVLSGSPPPGAEESIYASLIRITNRLKGKVFLDCQKNPLRLAMNEAPFLVKANIHEWQVTLDQKISCLSEVVESLATVSKSGCQYILMSLGGGGVVLYCSRSQKAIHAKHPEMHALNPIGSGDCLQAGLIAGYLESGDLEKALRLGVASGMANTQTLTSGCIEKRQVEKLLDCIELHHLKV